MTELQAAALSESKGIEASAKAIAKLSKMFGEEAARWAFLQWELRSKAVKRFPQAQEMLFTREALEQATHPEVAKYHASRFPAGQWVVDLTCSIGSDLIALAERGPTVGVDLDSERLDCARHNLKVFGVSAQLSNLDCLSLDWEFDYAFADPSRRIDGKRHLKIDEFSPSPDLLAERMREMYLGGIKLSPMLSDAELEAFGGQLEFISFDGECREAVVWLGRRIEDCRSAVHIESGEVLESSFEAAGGEPSEYLFEADPAAIRAHCLAPLCAQFGIWQLGDSMGYLTGPEQAESVWLTAFRVLEACKADDKAIKEALRRVSGTISAVKSRVKGIDPVSVERKFQTDGGRPVILVAYSVGKSVRWLIVERLEKISKNP